MRNSPNDVSGVVWALGEFSTEVDKKFFFFLFSLLITAT